MSWRENEDEWKYLSRHRLTSIEAKVTIKTSLVDPIYMDIKASLIKPRLAIETNINFGKVQLDDFSSSNIRLVNPTNETVQFRLLIDTIQEPDTYLFKEKMLIQIMFYMEGISDIVKMLSEDFVLNFLE